MVVAPMPRLWFYTVWLQEWQDRLAAPPPPEKFSPRISANPMAWPDWGWRGTCPPRGYATVCKSYMHCRSLYVHSSQTLRNQLICEKVLMKVNVISFWNTANIKCNRNSYFVQIQDNLWFATIDSLDGSRLALQLVDVSCYISSQHASFHDRHSTDLWTPPPARQWIAGRQCETKLTAKRVLQIFSAVCVKVAYSYVVTACFGAQTHLLILQFLALLLNLESTT